MKWEGIGQLPQDTPYGLLIRSEQMLSPAEVEQLKTTLGGDFLCVSQMLRFSAVSPKQLLERFKRRITEKTATRHTILVHDLPSGSPFLFVAHAMIRRWLKLCIKHKLEIRPGLLQFKGSEPTIRLARSIPKHDEGYRLKKDKLQRYLLTKLRFMDSALEVNRFYIDQGEPQSEMMAIAPPGDPELIASEMSRLDPEQRLCQQGEFEVWLVTTAQIPHTILEIGRLREMTFRTVGEGTGKEIDLDEYDLYYRQLIIWDARAKCVAGGYRIGLGDEIFPKMGVEGFYIHSLFKIEEGFLPIFEQSLELGRSYIIESYQKKRLPLFLLWKGILHFLLAHPHYRYLYGPVSISNAYSSLSKSLMIYFLKQYYFDHELAQYLHPRTPFEYPIPEKELEILIDEAGGSFEQLNNLVEEIEPQHFKLPVLLRQYIRQNARFISFNLDPKFSNALDGFIILDISHIPPETIEALSREKMATQTA